jgi:predicted glycosyltransferase
VQEQKIRAERMSRLGLFKMLHPAAMTPRTLMEMVGSEVEALRTRQHAPASLELDALPRISTLIGDMVWQKADRAGVGRRSLLACNGY